MATIKVISNPYLPQITFQKWGEEDEEWKDITLDSNPKGCITNEYIL